MNQELDSSLLDPKHLEEILGSFSKATGLRLEAVDHKGKTFYIPGNLARNKYCCYIRKDLQAERKCQDSYKRASIEASKFIY
ncbi:MAG: PocR ligand-binding domain-containing protein [Desulfitobacterium hafniense]|nr:PocR ligand-binding domain-containing protein [Desulfitobacterium hafniense]